MAHDICFFDLLPNELYTLFNFFLADEILYSFTNVSDHLNNVLHSYSSYQINFQSIIKSDFDKICREIRADQVISLILSDKSDTSKQSRLFLTNFNMRELRYLQSITLLSIEIDSLISIFSELNQLDQLRSLFSQILFHLNRLNLGIEINFSQGKSFVSLQYLKIDKCTLQDLEMIFIQVPQLISLDVSLPGGFDNLQHICRFPPLRRLVLKIIGNSTQMNEIEYILRNLPDLIDVNLQIEGEIDLFDGNRWQILSKNWIKFDFKIYGKIDNIEFILDSFSTSFWVLNKCWYVAYDQNCLFTIPKFVPMNVILPYYPPKYRTIDDERVFYDYIKKITIIKPPSVTPHRFRYIKELNIRCSLFPQLFLSIVDLNHLEHLTRSSLDHVQLIVVYIKSMPSLRKLSIKGNLTGYFIENIRLIDGFKHLSNASFCVHHSIR